LVLRKIVKIDESKCDGCGLCIPACPEGALRVINGKVRLVNEKYCDGLGACIKECPKGALTIEIREAEEFGEGAVRRNLEVVSCTHEASSEPLSLGGKSLLSHWPVKIVLINPKAPFLEGASILIAADCVPFAYANFHRDFLKDRVVLAGCPKFGDVWAYRDKLAQIFNGFNVKDVEVVRMEVPCCSGLRLITEEALKLAGKKMDIKEAVISVKGGIIS